ncbi:hypothetical protein KAF25_010936 [Fusarium avenaceum]|uniref:Uncharacterized protein n=1 Tax=Fusarium avenaceum TaxID=40199 RepID=A0A9P7GQZ8_9HYPO|nr:hypothetical protein KAF25_010936 [Fusarium avenaceum]
MSISCGKSLHDLSVENPWFAVHPLFWTARHLRLLQCSFSLQPTEATSDSNIHDHGDGHDASSPDQDEDEDELTRIAKRLATTRLGSLKALSVKKLLCPQGSPFYEVRGSPPFKFNNRRIHLPECDIYRVTTPDTPDNRPQPQTLPIIGYFHYDHVTQDREKALTPRLDPRGGFNWPVTRLYQRRLHGVTPDLWSEDPYLICLLLSLAQLQWRGEGSKSTTFPVSYLLLSSLAALAHTAKASLLVTNKTDSTHAHVFRADIPSDILQGLHEPKNSIHAVWPSIKHTKVPFQPYTNFSERIITQLVGVEYRSSVNVATADAIATLTTTPAKTTTATPTTDATATPTAISTTTTPTRRINKRKYNDATVPTWEVSPKRHAQGRQTPQCAGA